MYDAATIQKFWLGVQKGDGCWIYLPRNRRQSSGNKYRYFYVDGVGSVPSHRIAYEVAYGAIPSGHLIRHRCAVRSCCRPDHLLSGTHEENMWDIQVRLVMNIASGELATYEDFPAWRPGRLESTQDR